MAESLRIAHAAGALRTQHLARVTVDTTVQPKAINFRIDAKRQLRFLCAWLSHLIRPQDRRPAANLTGGTSIHDAFGAAQAADGIADTGAKSHPAGFCGEHVDDNDIFAMRAAAATAIASARVLSPLIIVDHEHNGQFRQRSSFASHTSPFEVAPSPSMQTPTRGCLRYLKASAACGACDPTGMQNGKSWTGPAQWLPRSSPPQNSWMFPWSHRPTPARHCAVTRE
jgi:hypothetical protein